MRDAMKIIPKDKAWICKWNGEYYCFDREPTNTFLEPAYNHIRLLYEDITVNSSNRIHSFNDKPALVSKTHGNLKVLTWFQNGIQKRENEERPHTIEVGYDKNIKYYIRSLTEYSTVNLREVRRNLK
jgi:hypothetical protein